MTLLGITASEQAKAETDEHSLRAEIVKRVALGGGWSVGAALVYGAYELLHSDPHDAFPLLRSWGPWAIVTIIALYFGYDVVKIALNVAVRGVTALEQLAAAQQQGADKDDRQIQEIQTLASFSAQESVRTADKMAELMNLVKDVLETTKSDRAMFVSIDKKLDKALETKRGDS